MEKSLSGNLKYIILTCFRLIMTLRVKMQAAVLKTGTCFLSGIQKTMRLNWLKMRILFSQDDSSEISETEFMHEKNNNNREY